MPKPNERHRVKLSFSEADYLTLQAAAKAAGYKSLAAYVYDATLARVLAEMGKQMRELRRGAPGKERK